MKTRALTASEATNLLIEHFNLVGMEIHDTIYIADNDYTRRFGESTFKWINPEHNPFNPALAYFTGVGVKFSLGIYEWNGQSNVFLYMWDGCTGKPIANYNKMKAAEKKEFIEMCLNAKRISYDYPFKVWEGWKDESYKDENDVHHTAWRTPDGVYHTSRELCKY